MVLKEVCELVIYKNGLLEVGGEVELNRTRICCVVKRPTRWVWGQARI